MNIYDGVRVMCAGRLVTVFGQTSERRGSGACGTVAVRVGMCGVWCVWELVGVVVLCCQPVKHIHSVDAVIIATAIVK